jgi:hypothetical protein
MGHRVILPGDAPALHGVTGNIDDVGGGFRANPELLVEASVCGEGSLNCIRWHPVPIRL